MSEEQKWLNFYSDIISRLAELGLKSLVRIGEKKDFSIYNTLGGILYIRKFYEILDSISLNIKNGITSTATNGLNRICSEYFFGAFFLLNDINVFEKRSLVITFLSIIEEAKGFEPFYKTNLNNTIYKMRNEYGLNSEFRFDDFDYSKTENYYQKLFSHKDFIEVKTEYERIKKIKKNNKIKQITWYSFWNGPTNVYPIAKYNKQVMLYETFYREFCHDVHGSKAFSKAVFSIDKDYSLYIHDFRIPLDINMSVYPSIYLSHLLFKLIFSQYLPEEDLLRNEVGNCLRSLELSS